MTNPLGQPVTAVRGVGPAVAERLARLGIAKVRDLLWHFPRLHQDRSRLRRIADLTPGQHEAVVGRVHSVRRPWRSGGRTILAATIADETGRLKAYWFGMPYLRNHLKPGTRVVLWGKVVARNGLALLSPEFEVIGEDEPLHAQRIVPIYPATAGLGQKRLRRVIRAALDDFAQAAPEVFPEDYRTEHRLVPIAEALEQVHFPESPRAAELARRRLVYEEFFLLETAIALRKRALHEDIEGISFEIPEKIDRRIRRRFPFRLTAAQERAIAEIADDMARPRPMNRLLQGDVGSGKTVVAAFAMLAAIANKHQAALMAPTEILAQQHYQTVSRLLKNSRVRILPLIGGMPKRKRRESLAAIAAGEVDIVIGTHALIQADVNFAGLGIIVVDEQHKFGVMQRGSLIKKSLNPDVLIMTATPIPRTLTMTVFGDLDVSIIDRMPPGRKRVKTWWVPRRKLPGAYDFIRKEINRGRQAYFVYPLVEESTAEQTRQLKNATKMAELLGKDVFPEFRVGLLHGRMSSEEKKSIMLSFRDGKIQVLVSTIVIEVGIDVPNATMMVIENAERFGLSQLHQLRGRIGRGSEESYCMLFGNPRTPEGKERLKIISRTSDGFKIAEEDLRLRGPGEFFGTRQHGLPELRIANIVEDYEILRVARRDAFSVAQKKSVTAGGRGVPIDGTYYGAMLKEVRSRFADMVELIGVG